MTDSTRPGQHLQTSQFPRPGAILAATLGPVAMARLAHVATCRSAGADDERLFSAAGLVKPARDGWIDLTDKGRSALTAGGYVFHHGIGWTTNQGLARLLRPGDVVQYRIVGGVVDIEVQSVELLSGDVQFVPRNGPYAGQSRTSPASSGIFADLVRRRHLEREQTAVAERDAVHLEACHHDDNFDATRPRQQ